MNISMEVLNSIPHSKNAELIIYGKILESHVLHHKTLWYRPHMRVILHRLDAMLSLFIEIINTFPYTKTNKLTRDIFIRVQELSKSNGFQHHV
jgi:hypothetical protein